MNPERELTARSPRSHGVLRQADQVNGCDLRLARGIQERTTYRTPEYRYVRECQTNTHQIQTQRHRGYLMSRITSSLFPTHALL